MLCFWAGNVCQRVCLGGAPRGMLLPNNVLTLISSFLSLFESYPTCVSIINIEDKLSDCLSTSLPGANRPTVIYTNGPSEFERNLDTLTVQIIERHGYRTILDFLLMKLRPALDCDWLQQLPMLHKVRPYFPIISLPYNRFFLCQL